MNLETSLRQLIDSLRSGDRSSCLQCLHEWESHSIPDETIYNDLLLPALIEIGAAWERNEISITEEHVATELVKQLIAFKGVHKVVTNGFRGTAVIGCVPGEHHSVGGMILSNLLQKDGWKTLYFGESVPKDDIILSIDRNQPELVCLISKTLMRLHDTIDLLQAIRTVAPTTKLMLGGIDHAEVRSVLQPYVDSFADCPVSAVQGVNNLVPLP